MNSLARRTSEHLALLYGIIKHRRGDEEVSLEAVERWIEIARLVLQMLEEWREELKRHGGFQKGVSR